ncbi:MAG: hypothetical protein KIH69_000230 [Anaerolineae bacterium]|nr:hypothetical protein [Anaerolineae bacterium]
MHEQNQDLAVQALHCAEKFQLLQPISRVRVLLRMWRYPAFAQWTSWTVISAHQGLLLRRLILTPHPIEDTPPILTGSEAILPLSTWKTIEKGLTALQILLRLDDVMGRDGITYGLEYAKFSGSTRLTWWQSPPDEWVGVADWWQKTLAAFETHLPVHVPPNVR